MWLDETGSYVKVDKSVPVEHTCECGNVIKALCGDIYVKCKQCNKLIFIKANAIY